MEFVTSNQSDVVASFDPEGLSLDPWSVPIIRVSAVLKSRSRVPIVRNIEAIKARRVIDQ